MAVEMTELSEIYDVLTLLENVMGDVETAEELLDRFDGRLDSVVESLEAYLHEDDFDAAAGVAHSLKGEAAVLGATQLREITTRLEDALRQSHHAAIDPLFADLRSACERCRNAHAEAHQALCDLKSSVE